MRSWLWVVIASSFVACSLDQSPGSGGLAVLIDSDMAVPKDVDQITVDVTQSGTSIKHDEQQFTEGRVGLPWEVRVPRTDDRSPATIRVVAYKEGRARVVREAITTIPTSYLGVLRMAVDYLCDGMVDEAGDSTCGVDQTCMQGTCAPATLTMDPAPYGALDMTSIAAARSADAGMSQCFDISACFAEATEVTPDPTTCSFVPTTLFGDHMNVALRLDLGSPGMCDDSACWVVLDSGDDGWKIVDGKVVLPPEICQRRMQGSNLRVAVTQLCDPKTQLKFFCGDGTPTVTLPGGPNAPVTNVTTAQGVLPAVGDACNGAGTRACGMCGKSDRMCQNGLWSSYAECTNEGECAQNQSEACGSMGTRACGGDCTWGRCESQRCEGAATRACGNCGTQHRACDNGVWGEWAACEEEGECTPNATEACGAGGTRACGGSCAWGPCGMQQCPGAPTQACGNCGMQMRTCDGGTATWSDWGPCQGEGACAQNATQTCGMNGTQTCGGKCQWDVACTGQTCTGAAAEACGNCGTRTRICDMNTGEWSTWSDCLGQGTCAPDTTRVCGTSGTGTQSCAGNCQWDASCTGQKCTGASSEACGMCGTRTHTCNTNNGTWSDWSACSNEKDCSPGATRMCGAGGMQTCSAQCAWPAACPGQMCSGSATVNCGFCGTQTRTCDMNSGSWSQPGTCQNPGVCQPGGSPLGCGTNAHEPCLTSCQWGACACDAGLSACGMDTSGAPSCKDLTSDEANCGKCGVACGNGQTCVGGVCQCGQNQLFCDGKCMSASGNANCGRCGNTCPGGSSCNQTANGLACVCPSGQMACNGQCTNVTGSDPTNCGGCGKTCASGQSCVAGQCMLVCGGGTPDKCNNTCTNTKSDEANCGSCGHACGAGQSCTDGVCCASNGKVCSGTCRTITTDSNNCGDCGNVCPMGTMCSSGSCMSICGGDTPDLCGGACTNVNQDAANCGKCGTRCDNGLMCVNGACTLVCGGGTPNDCSDKCTNTQSDPNNCGSCGAACVPTQMCVRGTCNCSSDAPLFCNGACVASSDANCGKCGNSCGAENTCRDNTCVCSSPNQMHCGANGTCVDVTSDVNNCGGCGMSCGPSQVCSNSQCVCTHGTACGMNPVTCVETSNDHDHCGNCDTRCQPNQSCMSGACMLMCAGTTPDVCGNSCVNKQTDATNCGVCDHACGPGQACVAGNCKLSCTGGTTDCGGSTCVDTNSDVKNCGGCDRACGPGETCAAGNCKLSCTGGTTDCGGPACVDTTTDANNCGGCNRPCTGAQSACVGGQCACSRGTMLCEDGSCQAQCACGAGTHRCGDTCVKISNSSCTGDCITCPEIPNGSSSCNTSADACEIKCNGIMCNGACCDGNQTCEATGCTNPAPPQGGQSGGPEGSSGSGDEPDSGVKMFDGGPILENPPPASPIPR